MLTLITGKEAAHDDSAKKWAILPVTIAMLFFLLLIGSNKDQAIEGDVEAQLISLIEKKSANQTVYIDFKKDLNIEFDNVYLFPPYTKEEDQKKILTFDWVRVKDIGIQFRDDINLFIFMKDEKLVDTIQLPRNYKIKLTEPLNNEYRISSTIGIVNTYKN
ncbi:hypothetical protein J2S13_002214 [Oikeobacillus pervagus]|uniref:Uncharacterized protein n=1 Tax=Oikeobacillus pervagus TaxID=1325931 RepID=A0AAJ1SZN0_9BACI|nr:hypothetical protein [Oikeobacillus pervagus]MDQ0215794.1 hypothetical protein [Oikeobacillus pervagus]